MSSKHCPVPGSLDCVHWYNWVVFKERVMGGGLHFRGYARCPRLPAKVPDSILCMDHQATIKGPREGVIVVLTPISQIWKLRPTELRTPPVLWDSHRLQDTYWCFLHEKNDQSQIHCPTQTCESARQPVCVCWGGSPLCKPGLL